MIEDQVAFMNAGNQETNRRNYIQLELYKHLIQEESMELINAIDNEPLENQVKEAVDVLVVTIGYLVSLNIDVQKAWELVHVNNMLKVQNVQKDETGKIIKSSSSKEHKQQLMQSLQDLVFEQ